MATYLQLVQDTATESGTVTAPATVAGLTGRQARFARWVQRAWREIQNDRDDWVWMDKRFSTELLDGVREYAADAFGITSFSGWRLTGEDGRSFLSVRETALGGEGMHQVAFREWDRFEVEILRTQHATDTGKPQLFSVTPQGALILYPIPDIGWTVDGRYQTGAQRLALDADIPEMPVKYHDAIMWKALTLMARFDEAGDLLASYNREYMAIRRDMVNEQTPGLTITGSIDA